MLLTAFVGVSDLGDPLDVAVEFLLAAVAFPVVVVVVVEDALIAVELRTFIEVRLLLALDGGGG